MHTIYMLWTAVALSQTPITGEIWTCGTGDALTLKLATCPGARGWALEGVVRGTRLSPNGPDVYPGDRETIHCNYRPAERVLVQDCSPIAEDAAWMLHVTMQRDGDPITGPVWANVTIEDADIDTYLPCSREDADIEAIRATRRCEP